MRKLLTLLLLLVCLGATSALADDLCVVDDATCAGDVTTDCSYLRVKCPLEGEQEVTMSVYDAWGYLIERKNGRWRITFTNDNIQNGVNIAIILNYGHGTASGAYVAGRNYIDPAIQPIFDKIADDVWKEVIA